MATCVRRVERSQWLSLSLLYYFRYSTLLSAMHTSEYDFLFKLLLIGDSGVGKVKCRMFYFQTIQLTTPVLSASAFRGRYLHGELHQYYWSWFQDPHYWAGGKDGETPNCQLSYIFLVSWLLGRHTERLLMLLSFWIMLSCPFAF